MSCRPRASTLSSRKNWVGIAKLTTSYKLLPAAESDLRDIIRYTRKQWGVAQARSYAAELQRRIEILAAGEGPFKDMAVLHPGLRMVKCEHHYIFCLWRTAAPTLVVAILHEKMDLMTRLASRLA